MGKKRSAARRAAATAAVAPAATPSPAVPFDTHAALVDTLPAPAVRESPTTTQQPRVSHEADATRAPRAASPTQPTIDASLDLEPATAEAHAPTPIAIATPQTHERHASDPRPEPEDSPPALTTPTSTSSDVSANSPQQPHISNHADTLSALRAPFPALSIHAAADLATAVDRAGPPNDFFAGPAHLFARANTCGREPESLAPRTSPAMSVEEIDEDLLDNIIEDAQNAMRIEARHEVRVMALKEGQERGWREGFEEGKRHAKREARVEEQQRERAWKDGYEQGRWDGYQEGLEIARTDVSTPSSVDTSVQADVSISPHSPPARTVPATPHVDASIQADVSDSLRVPPIDTIPASPSIHVGVQADTPISSPSPLDTSFTTLRVNTDVQTDDDAPYTLYTPAFAYSMTPRIDLATPRVDTGVQADAPSPPTRVHDTPSPRVHIGVQSDACGNSPAPSNKTHTPRPRIQASTQTDTPCTSAPVRARTVHEIDHDLLREILAAAIAKGEAAGLKKGKHIGFQDGMEAGWKSGTKEGREEGYNNGKQTGINEGREQYRLEVSRIPRAVAVVQTDYGPPPNHVDSASQTATIAVVCRRPSTHNQFPTIPHSDTNCGPAIITSTPRPTDPHQCTFISNANGNVHMPHDSFTTMTNTSFMCHNDPSPFSWADDTSLPPVTTKLAPIPRVPRDFSVLRSTSHHPFESLKRRARRSQPRPLCSTRSLPRQRPSIPISFEPVITRRHPAGLRADRPAVVVPPSSTISHSVKLDTPPLDWQGDPHLHELGRVLRGLGWVHSSGS